MKQVTTAIICDDHPLFRAGVAASIGEQLGIQVVAEAADGESCIAKMQLFRPDILIADLSMPSVDGFELLTWSQRQLPATRVFILSMHTDISFVQRARELGAAGFLAKEDAQSELLAAIGCDQGFYTSESIGRQAADTKPSYTDREFADRLRYVSGAEKKVLDLLTRSLTSRQIAEELCLSVRTVQAHRVSLANKLDAKGPNRLLEMAIRHRDTILRS